MRDAAIIFLFGLFIIFGSCSSEKADPEVDCSISDLSLALGSTVLPDCQNLGSISVFASGGKGDFLYTINGTSQQESSTFEDLSAGVYVIGVTDKSGCLFDLDVILNAAESSISATYSQTTMAGCNGNNGVIEITATGGVGDYTYSLDDGAPVATSTFSNLSNDSHFLVITDSEGCSTELSIQVLSGISLGTDIMPIINEYCATVSECHDTGSSEPVFKNNKQEVINNASRIRQYTQSRDMPPSDQAQLTNEQIATIACWIDDGALNN